MAETLVVIEQLMAMQGIAGVVVGVDVIVRDGR